MNDAKLKLKSIHKKHVIKNTIVPIVLASILSFGIAYAAFSDRGKVLGSSFSVKSADLRFLQDNSGPTSSENLTDELVGPSFNNIGETWQENYLLKVFNNGTTRLQVTSNSDYETVNDPKELRQEIEVEIFEWDDQNLNGELDDTELGISLGKKNIVKWKTEGIMIGEMEPADTKSLVLTFSTQGLSETKQGAQAIIDYVFDAIEIE